MAAPIDEAYLAFLRAELPKLALRRIPFWHRTLDSKHDTLRYCLRKEAVDPAGLIAEFGVFKGTTIRMIARRFPQAEVYGFDSFEGFPDDGRADWRQDFSLGGTLPAVPANVRLVKGYFDDTLPAFVERNRGRFLSLLHIDCDIYSSTRTIFEQCRPMIRPGCLIVFDELLHYNRFLHNEMLAFYEFVRDTGARFEWVGIRGKVLPIDDFLNPDDKTRRFMKIMKTYRAAGYEQEVALRITG